MAYHRSIQEEERKEERKEDDDDDDDDDEYNDTPFEPVSPECKQLILQVKHRLYNRIIFGPPLQSKKAQSNDLLLIYLKKMMRLYRICKSIENQTITEEMVQKKLLTFPIETRDIIRQLLNWITAFFRKNQYVDTIPYIDYLDVHLRTYPLLQK